jgi:hypothetical protein
MTAAVFVGEGSGGAGLRVCELAWPPSSPYFSFCFATEKQRQNVNLWGRNNWKHVIFTNRISVQ